MNGTRKIDTTVKFKNVLIHPIFLTKHIDLQSSDKQPVIPEMKDNKIILLKKKDKKKEMNNLASFMEKPYTSINSNLILDLTNIHNLIDIEKMLENKEFKTDLEFRYYFNLFIRKNLQQMSNVQFNLLISFLLNYFKNNDNINVKKMETIVNKWKNKKLEDKFMYNFIEYITKKI